MRLITIIIFTIIACNNNPNYIKLDSIVANSKSEKITKDSIDLIPAPFVVSNFPDTVKQLLHASDDSIWNIISGFYSLPKRRGFAIDSFITTMSSHHFSVDTLDNSYSLRYRGFNRRICIEVRGKTVDTISVSNQIWYRGKKFILINEQWKY